MFRIFLVILVILISGSIAEPLAKAYGDTVGNTVLGIIIIFWISVFIYQYLNNNK